MTSPHKSISLATIFPPARIAFLLILLVATTIAFFIVGNNGIFQLLKKASPLNISILFLLLFGRWSLMLLRSQLLLQANGLKLRHRDTLTTLWAYDFASESTPGGVGGPIVGLVFFKFFKVPASTTAAIAITGLVFDIFSVATLLAIAFTSAALVGKLNSATLATLVLSTMLFSLISMWMLMKYHRHILRMTTRSAFLKKLPYYPQTRLLVKFWLRTEKAFQRLKNLTFAKIFLISGASLGIWACRLSFIYFIILTLSHHISWPNAMLIQFVGGLATMITMIPGGFIGADLSIGALLLPFLDLKMIAGVILLWRLLTYHSTFILGGISFLWIITKIRKSKKDLSTLPSSVPGQKEWAQK